MMQDQPNGDQTMPETTPTQPLNAAMLVRATCGCGYTTTDQDTMEMWNGYGDHLGAASMVEPEHRVSIWTFSDGSIVIADNRDEAHPNDHHQPLN